MEVISLPPRYSLSPETPQATTPTKRPRLLYVLLFWCATLTISLMGMAGYIITRSREQHQASQSIQQETSPNHTELAENRADVKPTAWAQGQTENSCPPTHRCSDHQMTAIIHLKASDTQMEETLQWDIDNAATLYNFHYSQDSIIISSVGYYYIYSQVTFDNLKPENFEHHLLQKTFHYPHPTSLLEASITTGGHSQILSLGGAFCFDKGTKIYVNVSHPGKVDTEHTRTFFGAFLLAKTPSCRKKEASYH
uniref:Tumor necrosis factor ligand superfamily member 6-like n=1 Tax=Geotrypetes seraphini TaxID=260995 RepID=A0A6P8NWI0_GEOSA|nr:tumor necrosis factor ligand superfamily member 6-like [Geotrypetes seraphini]